MNDSIHDFLALRRLERSVWREAVSQGINRPNLYGDHQRATCNCLTPAGLAIYHALPRNVLTPELRTTARRMCESAARGAGV